MIVLTISERGGQPARYEFPKSRVTVGRYKGNDIVLPRTNVSKEHVFIEAQDGSSYLVTDNGSTNGTFINGRRIEGGQICTEADKIYVGDFIIELEVVDPQRISNGSAPRLPPTPPMDPAMMNRRTMPPLPNEGAFGAQPADLSGSGPQRSGFDTLFDPVSSDPLRGTLSSPPQEFGDEGVPSHLDPLRSTMAAPMDAMAVHNALAARDAAHAARAAQEAAQRAAQAPEQRFDVNDLNLQKTPTPGPAPIAPMQQPVQQPVRPPIAPPVAPVAPVQQHQPVAPVQQPVQQHQPVAPVQQPVAAVQQPQSQQSRVVALPTTPEIQQEFDPDFFMAQLDVMRALLDRISLQDLPRTYPPRPEDRAHFESMVQVAIDEVSPEVDTDALRALIVSECVGLGPIERYLDDPNIEDIYINKYDQVLLQREGKLVQGRFVFSMPDLLQLAAVRLLGDDAETMGADEVRFRDGTRVHVVMPPIAPQGPIITIRKPAAELPTLTDLIGDNVLSPGMADFLMRAMDAGRSIIIAGPTGAGKTSLLSALASLIPDGVRLISVEDYSRLELPQSSAVRLEASPSAGFDKRFLLRQAVQMHPQRILLDECRGAEANEWVSAVATGTEGGMLTLHGTSPSDALSRLESMCLAGSPEVSARALREQIARAVHVVVVVHRTPKHGFRVQQISEVQGVDLDAFRLADIFYFRADGLAGSFGATGYIPMFYEDMRQAGVNVDFDIFRE
jgi:pilus assembly protein CpaF